MSIRIVTSFHTLLHLARKLYEAEQTGDANKIRLAKNAHDEYKDLCLKHEMSLNIPNKYL